MQSILQFLATSQGLRGDEANIALAREIAASSNHEAVRELVANLQNKDKNIQSDCIKTLYEIGYLNPRLIAGYYREFLDLLSSRNNRLVWGGMIALSTITELRPREIFDSLDRIMRTVGTGSVITIDCGVDILSRLGTFDQFFDTTDPLLMEQLWKCPIKQLPLYVEKSFKSINIRNKEAYLNIINVRKRECDKDTQRIRLDKVLRKINGISCA